MIPDLTVRVKAYLIYFLFLREFEVVIAWIVKISSKFFGFWNCHLKTNLFNGIYKWVRLLFKKRHMLDCQKKIYFVQIMYLKFTLDDIRSYYYQPTNCNSIFLFEIDSEEISTCKLVSHLMLLPNLLRLRETPNALQLLAFFFFFSLISFFCQPYPEYQWIQSKKYFTDHQTANTIQLLCFYKKEIFRVYSFSE